MNAMDYIPLDLAIQQLITTDQAWHYKILPKRNEENFLECYIAEENKETTINEELELLFGKQVVLCEIPEQVLNKTLGKYYRRNGESAKPCTIQKIHIAEENFLQKIITEARSIKASDIHIEIFEKKARVRMRIDGKLIERYEIPKHQYPALINRAKIQANLDIAEKRLPQDGRISFGDSDELFDIRVSIIPALYGEKAVLRLLSKDAINIDINELGFNDSQKEQYLTSVQKPHGIILISGPTGSGKSTTLYATLKILNKEETNILTIEDPIEYTLPGVNQVQLKESIGLSFASALRTFLRQDPDIIMLGEIRDNETAQMAIRAALTGHLVLSTIHTNSAWGTVSRLIDMGIPPFLVAGTLNLTVAQRLVRLLCPNCKKQEVIDLSIVPQKFHSDIKERSLYTPVGCSECYYTGYKGRKALFEIIPVDHQLQELIKTGKIVMHSHFKERKILKIGDVAIELFANGKTSLEEIYPILLMSEL
jgi:type IV pilus assembly protein PilB